MTAPLLSDGAGLRIGRKLYDCCDEIILTVIAVDDGDFNTVYPDGSWAGWVRSYEVHNQGEPHHPPEMCDDGPLIVCYQWIEPEK